MWLSLVSRILKPSHSMSRCLTATKHGEVVFVRVQVSQPVFHQSRSLALMLNSGICSRSDFLGSHWRYRIVYSRLFVQVQNSNCFLFLQNAIHSARGAYQKTDAIPKVV